MYSCILHTHFSHLSHITPLLSIDEEEIVVIVVVDSTIFDDEDE
jgi:hypothetical protein